MKTLYLKAQGLPRTVEAAATAILIQAAAKTKAIQILPPPPPRLRKMKMKKKRTLKKLFQPAPRRLLRAPWPATIWSSEERTRAMRATATTLGSLPQHFASKNVIFIISSQRCELHIDRLSTDCWYGYINQIQILSCGIEFC